MTRVVFFSLIPLTCSVVGHRLQKTTNRFLVEWRDASELLDKLFFSGREQLAQRSRAHSGQHKSRIDTLLFKSRYVSKVERISSHLIVLLGPPTDP